MALQSLTLFHIESNTNIPVTLQIYSCGRTVSNIYSISEATMLDVENPGNETRPGSLIITEQLPSLLICVSQNKIGLCFDKLICVLVN